MNQLYEYQPTKITYILFNKGYKNCKKADYINIPPLDLIDAFLQIFKHANLNNYNNILVLEDDFIFHENIKDKTIQKEICTFINHKKNNNFIYLLGCIPLIKLPCNIKGKHYVSLVSLGTHACIYSKKNRMKTLKDKQEKILDWDYYNVVNTRRYTYYKPLCYQLFPDTENSNHWGRENSFSHIYMEFIKIIFKTFLLHKQVEPGYSVSYTFSKIFPFVLLTLFIILLIPIIRRVRKIKRIKI